MPETIDRPARDRMLRRARTLTEQMGAATEKRKNLGAERRALLLDLNRNYRVSYKRLAHDTGLSPSRLVQEIAKAKEEAGVTEVHPRFPAFGQNGDHHDG